MSRLEALPDPAIDPPPGPYRMRAARARQACAIRLVALIPQWMREIRAEMRRAAPKGLSVPLFRALLFARSRPGSSVSELAAHLGVALPTASVAVEKLVAQGFLLSCVSADNRRRRALRLTDSGSRAVARAMQHTTGVFADRLGTLDTAAIARIMGALDLLEQPLCPSPSSPRVTNSEP